MLYRFSNSAERLQKSIYTHTWNKINFFFCFHVVIFVEFIIMIVCFFSVQKTCGFLFECVRTNKKNINKFSDMCIIRAKVRSLKTMYFGILTLFIQSTKQHGRCSFFLLLMKRDIWFVRQYDKNVGLDG